MFVFGQSGCIWPKCFYSGKVVVTGQSGYTWTKLVLIGQNYCVREKWLYLEKIGCIRAD